MKRLKLNIQLFGASASASTGLSSNAGNTATLAVSFTENSTNVTNNTSSITVSGSITETSGAWSASAPKLHIYWNGVEKNSVSVTGLNRGQSGSVSATFDVSHNADGTASGYAQAYWDNGSSGTTAYTPNDGWATTANTPLTTIPRKSTVSGGSGNIGSSTTITITRASSSFTHTLTYAFGSASGTIATKTTSTSVSWTIPTSLYAQIPNSQSGTGTITCETFNGNTSLGTNTCSFTATATEAATKPTVSLSVATTDSTSSTLTGNTSTLIKGVSTVACTWSAAIASGTGGSITSKTINNTTVSSSPYNITHCSTNSFTLKAVSSRGYSNTVTKTLTLKDYSAPNVNFSSFKRTSATGDQLNIVCAGTWWNANFGSQANTMTIRYRYSTDNSTWGSWVSVTNSGTGNSISFTLNPTGFTYTNKYYFQFQFTDKVQTVQVNKEVEKGQPAFWINKTGFHSGDAFFEKGAIAPLIIKRTEAANAAVVRFDNTNGMLGAVGMTGTTGGRLQRYNKDYTAYEVIDRSIVTNKTSKTYTDVNTNIPTNNTLAYWNGAYNSSNSSNLTYAHQGTIQCKPTVLYNNGTGTTGTITLSQSAADFTYIVVYYYANNDTGAAYTPEHCSERIYSPNGRILSLNHIWWYSGGLLQINAASKYINGKSITTKYEKYINTNSISVAPPDSTRLQIYRIEGWK